MPTPEPGTRLSRPLPYEFSFSDVVSPSGGSAATVAVTVRAGAAAGGAFQQYNLLIPSLSPRRYTAAAGTSVTDTLTSSAFLGGLYSMAVHGPNGWVRALSGNLTAAAAPNAPAPALTASYNAPAVGSLTLTLSNTGASAVSFLIKDGAYGLGGPWTVGPVGPAGGSVNLTIALGPSGGWYDLSVVTLGSSAAVGLFSRRLMGRMETGAPSTSDPAYGNPSAPGLHAWPADAKHPELPVELITPPHWSLAAGRAHNKDSDDFLRLISREEL
jgi:phospholipase C